MGVEWEDLRDELLVGPDDKAEVARRRNRLLAEERAHRLAEARRRRQLTQKDIAASMGVTQSRVSAIERGSLGRAELGTLAAYVAALGGRLEIVADFGDEKLVIGDSDYPESGP
ncbi:XRE family transcriptional regulator [Actinomadura graeca]|uniref:XRE family transcriptional regulator n=1 Tax=Actinomadura graeca TaxID=2750812 RepID=A0ABX8QVD2_9ACTN|nr:XRE family transcriptional regulator [Actinomadura graeca]QXJ22693.1 XRE family transcriptional regulator [Actinomadura graeca]